MENTCKDTRDMSTWCIQNMGKRLGEMVNQVRAGRGWRYNCKVSRDRAVSCLGYCRCLLPQTAAINSSPRPGRTPRVHRGAESMPLGLECALPGWVAERSDTISVLGTGDFFLLPGALALAHTLLEPNHHSVRTPRRGYGKPLPSTALAELLPSS